MIADKSDDSDHMVADCTAEGADRGLCRSTREMGRESPQESKFTLEIFPSQSQSHS